MLPSPVAPGGCGFHRSRVLAAAVACVLTLTGCGDDPSRPPDPPEPPAEPTEPDPPAEPDPDTAAGPAMVVSGFLPSEMVAGDGAFTLSVRGDGFTETTVVSWDGELRLTAFESAERLAVDIPAPDLAAPATVEVTAVDTAVSDRRASRGFHVLEPLAEPPYPEPGLVEVADGVTCGVAADGRAHCWGASDWGALGNGPPPNGPPGLQPLPLPVDAEATFRLVTGDEHWRQDVCGLTDDGRALCWGEGAGSRPVEVAQGHRFESLDRGEGHACGVTPEGNVACWGDGYAGQLGNGLGGSQEGPVIVEWPESFRAVAAADEHTCALERSGRAVCWGRVDYLGIGEESTPGNLTPEHVRRPTAVAGGQVFSAVEAAGWTTCALTRAGRTFCWGDGEEPRRVEGVPAFETLALGAGHLSGHACGIAPGGELWCWGSNQFGQLGRGTTGGLHRLEPPAPAAPGHRFASVDAGRYHTCGVTRDGRGLCWGWRGLGYLGDGGTASLRATPVRVAGGHVFRELSGRCGLTADGALYCWGPEESRGYDGLRGPAVPTRVPGDPLESIAGRGIVCGLTRNGETRCTRPYDRSRLRPDAEGLVFTQLVAGSSAVSYPVASYCGLTAEGAAWCWYGGSPTPAPAEVEGGHVFRSLAAGSRHLCGLDEAGAAWCWGSNTVGQLGPNGNETCSNGPKSWPPSFRCSRVPVRAAEGHRFERIDATGTATCGWTAEGRRLCWGSLGYDYRPGEEAAELRAPLSDFREVAAGIESAVGCGIAPGGAAWCWGPNEWGELGNGPVGMWSVWPPVPVAGDLDLEFVEPWGETTCALDVDGAAWCWGRADGGQVGDGQPIVAPGPVEVVGMEFAVPSGG